MSRNIKIIVLLTLCVGIGLVNVFLMPPFMNPDEIQHFLFSANYAYAGDHGRLKDLEIRVVQLLKDYRWFHFIGVGPGWENIENLKDVNFLNHFTMKKYTISKSYFHYIYGKVLRLTGIRDPLIAFYFLRLLSFFIYLAIFFLSFVFYKKYFPAHWYYLLASQLLIYQLATILNSVNCDVLLTLLGMLFFTFAYRFMAVPHEGTPKPENHENSATKAPRHQESFCNKPLSVPLCLRAFVAIFLVLISALASLVKTGGILFFLYFFILLLFKYGVNRKSLKWLILGVFLFVIVFSWFNYWFPERFFKLYGVIFLKLRAITGVAAVGAGGGGDIGAVANIGFFDSIVDSFYFYTGWMGFKLSGAWYWVLKFFLLMAVIGVIVMVCMKKTAGRRWLVYGLVLIVVQSLATRFYYGSGLMAQGRYLYPLLIPIVMLIYKGLNSMEVFLKLKRNYLVISYILFLVLFFVMALSRVISVFYLEIASPHVGL